MVHKINVSHEWYRTNFFSGSNSIFKNFSQLNSTNIPINLSFFFFLVQLFQSIFFVFGRNYSNQYWFTHSISAYSIQFFRPKVHKYMSYLAHFFVRSNFLPQTITCVKQNQKVYINIYI